MKKADAWVVLRLDGDAIAFSDYVAVKGVYDHEDAARLVQAELSTEGIGDSKYVVVRSRRYVDENSSMTSTNRIQGFDIQSSEHTRTTPLLQEINAIQNLLNRLPSQVRRRTILPLLSSLAEYAVAEALGASHIDDPRSGWNLELPDGKRIEVKTVLLDPEHKKSPSLQFQADKLFDAFAVVVFRPDLTIETARMIPVDALELYSRPGGPHLANQPLINVRVTQQLLNYPGSKNIEIVSPLSSLSTG